jgi:predicted phosphoadenosine phosphosulfate sulfurtransferase
MKRVKLNMNVFDAALMRLDWVFDTFEQVCLSFSGGKDSTVLFHLAAAVARKKGKKFAVLFVDWEAQYLLTIQHVQNMKEALSGRGKPLLLGGAADDHGERRIAA